MLWFLPVNSLRIPVSGPPGVVASFRPIARWLGVASLILILYGSLSPFHFSDSGPLNLFDLVRSLRFQKTSRGDLVANLLLYMPLGLCLMLGAPAGWSRIRSFCWAALCGTL